MPETHLPRVRELLAGHSTVTLATTHEGRSWAATVFYASDSDLNLYFVYKHRALSFSRHPKHHNSVRHALRLTLRYRLNGGGETRTRVPSDLTLASTSVSLV